MNSACWWPGVGRGQGGPADPGSDCGCRLGLGAASRVAEPRGGQLGSSPAPSPAAVPRVSDSPVPTVVLIPETRRRHRTETTGGGHLGSHVTGATRRTTTLTVKRDFVSLPHVGATLGVGRFSGLQAQPPKEAPHVCTATRHAEAGAVLSPAPETPRPCSTAPSVPLRTGPIRTTNGNEIRIRTVQPDVSRPGRGTIERLFSQRRGCACRVPALGPACGRSLARVLRSPQAGVRRRAGWPHSPHGCARRGDRCRVQARLAGLRRG